MPGEHIVPSDVVFTGLADFPAYRFVVAVVPIDDTSSLPESLIPPTPTEVRDGEPLSTKTVFFQELRAIPTDAPRPVTDAWLATSKAPTSGSFTRHPYRATIESGERLVRARFHVRQIKAGWIAIEFLSASAFMADGSERPLARPIPMSYEIAALEAPPGWQFFLMEHPAWPHESPPPPIPCAVGDILPLSPGPRTVVAVQGTPGPDGSVAGKPFVAMVTPLHAWIRDSVPIHSAAVASRRQLELQVEPGERLRGSISEHYQDAQGRWFQDEDARLLPVDPSDGWPWWWAACGGAVAMVATGFWILRRRARARG